MISISSFSVLFHSTKLSIIFMTMRLKNIRKIIWKLSPVWDCLMFSHDSVEMNTFWNGPQSCELSFFDVFLWNWYRKWFLIHGNKHAHLVLSGLSIAELLSFPFPTLPPRHESLPQATHQPCQLRLSPKENKGSWRPLLKPQYTSSIWGLFWCHTVVLCIYGCGY